MAQPLQIFETSQTDSWGRTTVFLNVMSPEKWDGVFVSGMKNRTKATSRKVKDGRWVWSIASDSRTADEFREVVADAILRSM
jgi:hypothetical protein